MRPTLALLALLAFAAPAAAQDAYCVPGNPLYDGGDYRCFNRRPRPSRARATVQARVEAARHLSGASLSPEQRDRVEDQLQAVREALAGSLPALTDERGALHTPDVRLSVVFLASGSVGRVQVLTRHTDALDRRIASALAGAVSEHAEATLDGSELQVIVRLRPRLRYTHYRPRVVHVPCCVEVDDE
ncbi:MAG: hypothetical protein R3A48_21640 [Polyangiales bacterium]